MAQKFDKVCPSIAKQLAQTQLTLDSANTTQPDADGELRYVSGTGFRARAEGVTFTIPSSTGSATAYDDIGDPDANGTIAFGGYTNTWTSTLDNGSVFTISNTDADLSADTRLIDLKFTDDGDSNGIYLRCLDNSGADAKFTIGVDGATIIAGNASGTDALTLTNGDITVTSGNITVDAGEIQVSADNQKLTLGASDSTDAYLTFNGTDLLFYDSNYGSTISLTSLANNAITGDLVVSDGNFNWTDSTDEAGGTWTFAGTTATDISIASSITTGKSISITADALTTGTMLYLDSDGLGSTAKYIQCYDGSANDFTVGIYGGTTIAGNAATDVLTVSAGDVQITAGDIDVDAGKVTIDTVDNETTYVKRNLTGATAAVVEIEATHTGDTGSALLIDHNGTGNAIALEITHDGDYAAINVSAGAARTGNVINIPMANQLAETALDITGAATGTASEGIVHVDVTGALAGNAIRVDSTGANAATGQLIYSKSTGNQAAATNGISGYFEDTGTEQATSYCVYIASTNNEALLVDTGKVVFHEDLTLGIDGTAGDFIAYGDTAGKYLHWDQSEMELRLTGASILAIGGTSGAKDGLTIDFDGADIDIDAVTANDTIKFGSDVDTNVVFNTASGAALTFDHGADTATFSATCNVICTGGSTAGDGFVIPSGTASPTGTTTSSIYFETDANKLWVYNGIGWVGVTLA